MGTNDKGRLTEDQIEKMIKEAEQFADEDKKVKERVDAKNAFDGYLHSMRSAVEGSGDNKGLSEKLDSDEKEKIQDALKDGQSWLDSNPEADAEEIKENTKRSRASAHPSSRSTTAAAVAAARAAATRMRTRRPMSCRRFRAAVDSRPSLRPLACVQPFGHAVLGQERSDSCPLQG